MASSLFALLDDIATVLDDVSLLTKVAAKKTSGVLGDDLALNAQQVAGVTADRELPVVFAVARGSAVNKAILVPAALAISALAPWAITPLLMIGGAYLCFEGVEKLAHKYLHSAEEKAEHEAELLQTLADPEADLVAFERDKIRGAVRTDFILSAEIIVISLGTVAGAAFGVQVAVLIGIAIVMTIGVYGLVAAIVKLDDVGLWLSRREGDSALVGLQHSVGGMLLSAAPLLMKFLSVAGTVAMFLVGGGILVHGLPALHHIGHDFAHAAGGLPAVGGVAEALAPLFVNAGFGILAGALVLLVVSGVQRLAGSGSAAH